MASARLAGISMVYVIGSAELSRLHALSNYFVQSFNRRLAFYNIQNMADQQKPKDNRFPTAPGMISLIGLFPFPTYLALLKLAARGVFTIAVWYHCPNPKTKLK